ncbi:MAG: hypothetical protein L6V81_07955 [Clostridium sp.]|nr:MAG: hypothetical protein L6V81_07955 [Clostridium sp.]
MHIKKVSEIFINEKNKKTSDRNSWPVVLDSKRRNSMASRIKKKSNLDKKKILKSMI